MVSAEMFGLTKPLGNRNATWIFRWLEVACNLRAVEKAMSLLVREISTSLYFRGNQESLYGQTSFK